MKPKTQNLSEKLPQRGAGSGNITESVNLSRRHFLNKISSIAPLALVPSYLVSSCSKDSVEEPVKITEPIEVVEPQVSVAEKRAEVETFLENATPVFSLSGPTELELPFSLTELTEAGEINWDNVVVYPKNFVEVVEQGGKTVLKYTAGPYNAGNATLTVPEIGTFTLPDLQLDFSAENLAATENFLKEQFTIAWLEHERGEPVDEINRWTEDIKMYVHGDGTEQQKELAKSVLEEKYNALSRWAMEQGLVDFMPQFVFVNSLAESSGGNTQFILTTEPKQGTSETTLAGGVGFDPDRNNGGINSGGMILYNTDIMPPEKVVRITLHEAFGMYGPQGEISARHIGTPHLMESGVLFPGTDSAEIHSLNVVDVINLVTGYALLAGRMPAAEALAERELVKDKILDHIKSGENPPPY